MRLLFFISEPNSVLNMGCFHYVAYNHGVGSPMEYSPTTHAWHLSFSQAPWVSLGYQIPQGTEVIGERRALKMDTHMLQCQWWPLGAWVSFLRKLPDLWKPPLSMIKWEFPLTKRNGDKRKLKRPLEVVGMTQLETSEDKSFPLSKA
uniref:Uncharacterized protein n=1 Tax=Gorilla gorilla gorilla TaxID=9595 RepID=A0A2I2ZBS1_GORGO